LQIKKMKKFSALIFGLSLFILNSCSSRDRMNLGSLESGAVVTFGRDSTETWGIQISGKDFPVMNQQKPAQIEVFRNETNVSMLASGYESMKKQNDTLIGYAKISYNNAVFDVQDRWSISGDVLKVSRKVSVNGTLDSAGFLSAIRLTTEPGLKWEDASYFSPDVLYGDPTYDGETSPGGTLAYKSKNFSIREDYISAPLFGLSFKNGNWAAVLDLSPDGATTQEETSAPAFAVIDEQLRFGAVGAKENPVGGVEFGFWMPGTTTEFAGGGFGQPGAQAPTQVVRRRYNPVKDGFSHEYQVGFRFSKGESFNSMVRDAWRWAWESLKPHDPTLAVRAFLCNIYKNYKT
jgi:hypothetical protein